MDKMLTRLGLGVGLAAAITTGGVLTAKSFRWGIEMAAETGDRGPRPESAMVIIAYGVGNLLALPLLAGAATVSPAGSWPGHRARKGTRIPPSNVVPLPSRIGKAEPAWLP